MGNTITKQLNTYSQGNNEYEIRKEVYQGKEHIIAPIVMMVEGVHSGSKGAILHTAEELGKVIGAWNGIPVVINHPKKDDEFISANSPEVLDSQSVGRIYNTYMKDKKLMAEAWMDPEKLEKLSALAYDHILNQKPLDVSVGVFTEDTEEEGEYNNEIYEAIATNYRPDHLALLPGGEGACSWNDGCGVRVNEKKEEDVSKEINADNPLQRTKFNTNKKEDTIMSEEKKPWGGCMEKIVTIIQSNETPYTEDHREWLLTQEEAFLDKLIPKEPAEVKIEPVQVNKEQALEVLKETIKNQDDFIELLPDNMKDSMKSGLALHQEARQKMIDEIQSNANDVWTKEELDTMNFATLKKVHSSMKIPIVDYSLNGGNPANNNADMEVLTAPGVEIKE